MNKSPITTSNAAAVLCAALLLPSSIEQATAFTTPSRSFATTSVSSRVGNLQFTGRPTGGYTSTHTVLQAGSNNPEVDRKFDELLDKINHSNGNDNSNISNNNGDSSNSNGANASQSPFADASPQANLRQVTRFFRSNPDIDLTRERWNAVFDAVEITTGSEARGQQTPDAPQAREQLITQSRMEMTDVYSALKERDQLRMFGAVQYPVWPASGSKTIDANLLERITDLPMQALTPKTSNLTLYAGAAVAVLEGLVSAYYGLDFNSLVLTTVMLAVLDKALLNGAVQETVVKAVSPNTQKKITRHEAGHMLCAYLLGCPIEGYVLSAWASLQDSRFEGVSAGTSFFDPILSDQIANNQIKRSTVDRYSIIVMAGIAAEAVQYGQADGGGGDEMALIQFLLQMNGGQTDAAPWNDITIRNQARWGALQAVLIIREYQECYDALVDAMESGGSLGDCIYAIEKAGRDSGKLSLTKPLGLIIDEGVHGEWKTDLPDEGEEIEIPGTVMKQVQAKPEFDPEQSLETLAEYKKQMEDRLKTIESELQRLD